MGCFFIYRKVGDYIVKDNKKWYICPLCGKKILKYDELKGKSKDIYIKCKQCKKEIEIKID